MGYFKNKLIAEQDSKTDHLIPDNWQELQRKDEQEMEDALREKRHKAQQGLGIAVQELKIALQESDPVHCDFTRIRTALDRVKVTYEAMFQGELW